MIITQMTSSSSSTPRVWLCSVFIVSTVVLVAYGGPSADVGEAEDEPMPVASGKSDEARTRLMASEGGQMVLDVIEKHGGLEAWYAAPTSAYS